MRAGGGDGEDAQEVDLGDGVEVGCEEGLGDFEGLFGGEVLLVEGGI